MTACIRASSAKMKCPLFWFILAVIADVLVFQQTTAWGLSARQLAGFLSAGLVLAGALPSSQARDRLWLAGLWLLLSNVHGGLLGSLLSLDCSPLLASVVTSLISLWALQQLYMHRNCLQNIRAISLAAVAYLVLLRLVYLGLPELIFEEAYYWDYAQHLDYGYLDHPLVTALIIKMFTVLLGNHEFGVRMGAFLCWFVTGYYVYRLTKESLNETQASISLLLAAALPAYFFFGFFMSPDAPLTACWAAGLYYSYRILHKQDAQAWYGLAISLGIGMSSKYTIALLVAGLVLLLLADKDNRHWWGRKQPYLALLIVLCLFSPVIVWNYQHEWASFTFQSEERANSGYVFSLPRYLGNILVFATPVGVLSLFGLLWQRKLVTTSLCAQFSASKAHWQIAFLGAFPIVLFGLLSVARTSKLNWTGPAWLGLLPLFGLLVNRQLVQRGLLGLCQRSWPAVLGLLLLIYGVGMHFLSIGYLGLHYPHNTHLIGWKPLGAQFNALALTESKASNKPVLVVALDRNRIASGLAFYRGMAEQTTGNVTLAAYSTTSQNLLNGNGLMFGWWFAKDAQRGSTLLLVSDDVDDLDAPRVRQHSTSLGATNSLPVTKNGQNVGILYYRFAYNYQP